MSAVNMYLPFHTGYSVFMVAFSAIEALKAATVYFNSFC